MCLAPEIQLGQRTLPDPKKKRLKRKALREKHKIGLWNCCGLSHERYELVESGDLKHKCDKCDAGFYNNLGLRIHKARWCGELRREIFERQCNIEKILDVRGPPKRRFFKIKWEGHDLNKDEKLNWEPIRHLIDTAEEAMEKFWLSRPDLNIEANIHDPTEHRCCFCNNFYKRAFQISSEKPLHQGLRL